jgi:hypothetical protein
MRTASSACPSALLILRAGVSQVLALEENARAAVLLRETLRLIDGRRPADVVLQQPAKLRGERGLLARREVRALELLDRLHERFGDEPAAELAEISATVRIAP